MARLTLMPDHRLPRLLPSLGLLRERKNVGLERDAFDQARNLRDSGGTLVDAFNCPQHVLNRRVAIGIGELPMMLAVMSWAAYTLITRKTTETMSPPLQQPPTPRRGGSPSAGKPGRRSSTLAQSVPSWLYFDTTNGFALSALLGPP